MDKKKAVKLATASAVAASAFVAANPHTSQAATDVATVVSQAKAKMKEAYYTYSHTVTETGKLPNISDVYAAYNKAKKAYANAVAVVNKAGGAKKDAYLADLQAAYETYVFKANPKSGEARVATYIDAYKYAVKLDGLRQDLAKAVEAKDLKKAEELYRTISSELKKHTVIIGRVYGQSTRELLRSQFIAEAQKLRDSLIYDITVAMKAREAQDAVKAGNLDKAKAALDQVNQYVSKVTDTFKAELQKAAQDAKAAYEAALTPKVESVSAINVNKIKVTFSKAVDTTKAKFEVKRGTVTEDVKVTWNEAKTEAVLEKTAGNFTPADYTVTVSGVDGLVNASNNVKIEAEQIKEIKITNTALQKTATAPLAVEFINQYGEKATVAANDSKLTITAFNKTKGTSLSRVPNKFQIDASGAELKDEVVVTVMYNGVSVTKTLNVVAPASVGSVSLGEVVLPAGKDKFTPSGTTNVEVKYTAKNTLDESYTLTAADKASGAVQFLSSDNTILDPADVSIDADGKIKIAKFKKEGKVTLSVFTPATGAVSKVDIEVKADPGVPSTVELEKSAISFAAGSTTAQYVGLTVKDNYGTPIATKDLKASDYTITSDNPAVVANDANLALVLTGENAGKIKIVPQAGATKGQSATITVLVKATGQKATFTVTASDAAVPTTVEVEKDFVMPTNLLTGASAYLNYDIKDQYGTILSSGVTGYTVEYTTSDPSVLSITSGETPADGVDTPQVTVKALKEGSATIKAVLKKDGVAIAEKATTINVVKNDSSKVTYGVTDIAPLYKDSLGNGNGNTTDASLTSVDTANEALANGYYRSFDITATDANGAVSKVPYEAVIGTPEVVPVEGALGANDVNVFYSNGKWYIGADVEAGDFPTDASGNPKDIKAKLRFTIANDGAAKVVEKEFTISKDDLKAAEMKVVKDTDTIGGAVAIDAANPTKLATDTVAVSTIDATSFANLEGISDTLVVVKDQFGKWVPANSVASATYDDVTVATANLKGFKDQGTASAVTASAGVVTFAHFTDDLVFAADQSFQAIFKHATLDPITVTVGTKATPLAADTDAVTVVKKNANQFTVTVTDANKPTGATKFKVFSRSTGAYTVADLNNATVQDVTGATTISGDTSLDVTAAVAGGNNQVLVVFYNKSGDIVGFSTANVNLQ